MKFWELEYILYGKGSDTANLRKAVKRLLLLRYGADALYIFTDSEKKEIVEAVVTVICTLLLLPEIEEPITDLILLGWAYGESVSDVVRLLAGERVPLNKTGEDWKMPIWGLLSLKTSAHPTGGQGSGFSYKDYLRVFLFMENRTTKCMRAMDIIEMNLRNTAGNSGFRMDGCVEYVYISAVMSFKGKNRLTIDRKMSYMSDF